MNCQAQSTNSRAATRATSSSFAHTRTPGSTSGGSRLAVERRVSPASSIAFDELISLARPPSSGGVIRKARRLLVCDLPGFEDRVHQAPGGFHAVGAVEERRVAAHAVVQERGIRAARASAKRRAVAKIHRDGLYAHLRARELRAKDNRDALVGLDVKQEPVGFDFAPAKHHV